MKIHSKWNSLDLILSISFAEKKKFDLNFTNSELM